MIADALSVKSQSIIFHFAFGSHILAVSFFCDAQCFCPSLQLVILVTDLTLTQCPNPDPVHKL